MLKASNVKIPLKTKEQEYPKILSSFLNIPYRKIHDVQLLKRSIDARKNTVHYICSFAFRLENEEEWLAKHPLLSLYEPYVLPTFSAKSDLTIVVGSGPAGLFCAWLLAKSGSPVMLLERGEAIEKRVADVESFFACGKLKENSNIQFGEGGAGTFSDGKLTTGIKDPRVRTVLQTFAAYGAPKDILVDAMPHIGTDYLRKVIVRMRHDLIAMGVQIAFNSQMTALLIEQGRVAGVVVNHEKEIRAKRVVLAIGHSARDTFEWLYAHDVALQAKPFAVGLRVEHLQRDVNLEMYKKAADQLKAAPYKLTYRASNQRGVYTFCMCPGGKVVAAASEEGRLVTNGMSTYARDAVNANAAILVSVDGRDYGQDHPLAGMAFQRELESKAYQLGGGHYQAPCSLVVDYLAGRASTHFGHIIPSYRPGVTLTDLNQLFSSEINTALHEGLQAFGRQRSFFQDPEAVLTGVETRSSSPVRILRDDNLMASLKGLYPCGEGAGYAGGIVSAAVDGLKVAEAILTNKDENG